ncbi:MAG TPA: hypothetical protein VI136_15670 [Verrucomicrobiae bacterium]
MISTTIELIRAALKTDPTVSPADRTRLLVQLRQRPDAVKTTAPPENLAAIWTRKRVAEAMGSRSLRFVDRLAQDGILEKVKLPGRQRGAGFRAADVQRLIGEGAK